MKTDEERLLRLRNELYEEWIEVRRSGRVNSELIDRLYLYMNQLEYVLHGARGHPDFS